MAYQPKSYRKFLAGTVSAAVVASAIAPVASASFTDVAGSVHADDIATLVAKGYIKGYSDGTFKPDKPLTRGEAAIIFSRILKDAGVKAPEQGAGFPDVPASKAELAEAVAIVKAAGVMGGDEKGNFNPNANITREQMAKVVVEAFKLTKPANHTTKITDLDKAGSWAREYIQTLEANGVTKNTEFAPKQNVTRGQFASFVVRAMDVKKEVSAADITAVKLVDEKTLEVTFNGELKEVKKEDFAIQGVEIDSVSIKAAAAAEAKTTVVVIKTKTALQEGKSYSVSYKGQTTDKAKVNVPVVTPKVESVSANNLKTIAVKFNQPIDSKTVSATTVVLKDGSSTITVDRKVSKDGKTLYLVSNSQFSQSKSYDLLINGVKTKDGKDVAKYEEAVKVLDTTVPTVEAVQVTSPKTVEIQFSEAVNFTTTPSVLTDIVQIDGINAYASKIDVDYTTGKVTLTLGTALKAGEHKVKIAKVQDFAGFPIEAKEFTVTVANDTLAPEVTAVEVVNKDLIKVTFSEPVDDATVQANKSNIKVNNTSILTATAKEGGKVYEMGLGAELGLAAVVEAKLEYKGIKDHYGNEVKETKSFTFKATDDTAAPVVTSTKVNSDNTIEITFSEDVDGFTTANAPVELYDKDNKKLSNAITITPKTIDGTPSKKVYVLTITGGSSLSGNHTLKILKDKVTDISIRENKFSETTIPVTLNDKVAPTIVSAKYVNEDGTAANEVNKDTDAYDAKVVITFDKAMDPSTLTNKSNYMIGNLPLTDVLGASLTVSADNKAVTITIDRDAEFTFSAGTSDNVRVLGVKDAAGNILASNQLNTALSLVQFQPTAAFSSVIDTSKVELVAKNKIKLYANTGYKIASVDPNKLSVVIRDAATLANGTELAAQVIGATIAADGSSVELTLSTNLESDAKFIKTAPTRVIAKLLADAEAIVTTDNVKTNAIADADSPADGKFDEAIALVDKVGPSLVSITRGATTDKLVVTFDEAIVQETAAVANNIANDLVVTVNGKALDYAAGDFTVVTDDSNNGDNNFEIQILKNGIVNATDVKVELKDGRYVVDTASPANRATAFAATSVTLTSGQVITELQAPVTTGISISTVTDTDTTDDEYAGTVTFTKATSEADIAKYVVKLTNGTSTVNLGEVTANGSTNYSVTIPANTALSGTVKVQVIAVDAAGNQSTAVESTITDVVTP